jgi:pimeloyl-ACP methyl ester carboxylesterase
MRKNAGPEMECRPALAPFGRRLKLGRGGSLFYYDSAAGAASSSARGIAGAEPTILLIHGLGDEADSWHRLFPLLAREGRVLAPDLPGFGRSVSGGRVTLFSCADAILALLGAARVGGTLLAGSSLGAVIAQLVAARMGRRASRHAWIDRRSPRAAAASSNIAALALIDGGFPGLGAPAGAWRMLAPVLGERGYSAFRGRPDDAYCSLQPYYAELDALPVEDRAFLRERVVARVESDSQMRAYFSLFRSAAIWAAFKGAFFKRSLAAFEGPVLVAWGEEDRVAPPRGAELLLGLAKRGKKALLAGSGHLPQQERPQELAAALLDLAREAASREA